MIINGSKVESRTYTNRKKIKEFIFNLKQKFGKELVVVSGGQKDRVLWM